MLACDMHKCKRSIKTLSGDIECRTEKCGSRNRYAHLGDKLNIPPSPRIIAFPPFYFFPIRQSKFMSPSKLCCLLCLIDTLYVKCDNTSHTNKNKLIFFFNLWKSTFLNWFTFNVLPLPVTQ